MLILIVFAVLLWLAHMGADRLVVWVLGLMLLGLVYSRFDVISKFLGRPS